MFSSLSVIPTKRSAWRDLRTESRLSSIGNELFDQNLALTAGEPGKQTELLALNIYNTFYGRTGFEGVGQAKAVVFTIIVATIALLQLRITRSKEVEQ